MIPRWRGGGALDDYRRVRRDPLAFLTDVVRAHGDLARIDFLTLRFYLVNDPALIHEALVEKSEVLIIKGGVSRGLARLIGDGILTNRGERWRESRARLKPLFHQAALGEHGAALVQRVQESLDRWRTTLEGEPIPLHRELLALSFRVGCSVLFGYLPSFDEALELADAIRVLQRQGMDRYLVGGDYMAWLPTASNRDIGAARAALVGVAERAIEGGADQTVEDILSLLFAGTESPVTTLCFALQLLEDHPAWRERLLAEVSTTEDRAPFDGGPGTDLVAQVLNETMRLYPAGWAFERYACSDVILGGEKIPKGSRLLFSPYLMHRKERIWPDAERFDPGRFARGPSVEGVPKYGFMPFGAGPRSCIGSRLAMAQMRAALRMIMAQCQWKTERAPGEAPLTAEGSYKLRLSRPLLLRLEPPSGHRPRRTPAATGTGAPA